MYNDTYRRDNGIYIYIYPKKIVLVFVTRMIHRNVKSISGPELVKGGGHMTTSYYRTDDETKTMVADPNILVGSGYFGWIRILWSDQDI